MYYMGVRFFNKLCSLKRLYPCLHSSILSSASSSDINQFTFKHLSLKLPLNHSMNGLSVGFLSLEKSKVTLFSYTLLSRSLLVNSESLSTCIRSEVIPLYCLTSFKILTTFFPLIVCPTRVARHWRLKLSTKDNILNSLPLNRCSDTTCRPAGRNPFTNTGGD